MACGLSFIHSDTVRPVKKEKPKMKRFREEFMSISCKLEIPTATIKPASTCHNRVKCVSTSCCNSLTSLLTKQDEKRCADDRVRHGDKQCTEFVYDWEDEHERSWEQHNRATPTLQQSIFYCIYFTLLLKQLCHDLQWLHNALLSIRQRQHWLTSMSFRFRCQTHLLWCTRDLLFQFL